MKSAFIMFLLFASVAMAGQNVIVVFDDSGSMSEGMGGVSKIEGAKKALKVVLSKCPEETKVGILAINAGWIYQFGPVSGASSRVDRLSANGGTPLGRAMKDAGDVLLSQRQKEKYATYRMIVVTDGEANDSDLMEKYASDIVRKGIVLDVIGVKMSSDHSLSKAAHTYKNANDSASLQKAVFQAMAERQDKGSDSNEDFELLQPIPVDMAKQAIQALTEFDNSPVSQNSENLAIASVMPKADVFGFTALVFVAVTIIIAIVFVATKAMLNR